MVRGKERPWMIGTRGVSKRDFKLTLFKIIQMLGAASPTEVAEHMSIDMTVEENKRRIWNLFESLQKSQRLIKVSRGKYKVNPQIERLGVNKTHQLENEIVKLMRENGGIMRQRDILEAFGLRPHGAEREATKNHWQYTQIREMLLSGPPFYTDFGRGVYNLAKHELKQLVLLGRWVQRMIYMDWWKNDARWPGSPTPFDRYERQIEDIGAAFGYARLRLDLTYEDVAQHDQMRKALEIFLNAAELCKNRFIGTSAAYQIRQEWDRDEKNKGKGITQLDMYVSILKRFEEGNTLIHECAPLEFYIACARLYSVCPLALSRGAFVPDCSTFIPWAQLPEQLQQVFDADDLDDEHHITVPHLQSDAPEEIRGLEEEIIDLLERNERGMSRDHRH